MTPLRYQLYLFICDRLFVHLRVCLFVGSFVRLFVRSFVRLFVCSFVRMSPFYHFQGVPKLNVECYCNQTELSMLSAAFYTQSYKVTRLQGYKVTRLQDMIPEYSC